MAEVVVVPGDEGAAEAVTAAAGAVGQAASAVEAAADAAAAAADALAEREVPVPVPVHEEGEGWQVAHEQLASRVEGLEGALSGRLDEIGTRLAELSKPEIAAPPVPEETSIVTPDVTPEELLEPPPPETQPWWKRML